MASAKMAQPLPSHCCMIGMNTTELQSISRDLKTGKPLWGALKANEYLLPDDPLRRALCLQARQALSASPWGKAVIEGARLSDLPLESQLLIKQALQEERRALALQKAALRMVVLPQRRVGLRRRSTPCRKNSGKLAN